VRAGLPARRPSTTSLAALVDDALATERLAAAAHPADWPEPDVPLDLPRELWSRALGDVARDILGRPSRRFRGRLAELAWQIAHGPGSPPRLLGALVEIIHAGSLIVDDVEDGSTERRGAPCVHVSHGVPLAVNGGSWMYFWALSLVEELEPAAPLVRARLYRLLAEGMQRCHLGQALDLSVPIGSLPRATVYATVATATMLKTGTLMELAARLGAVVGGAPAELEESLARFGRRLGLGLQMLDDFGNLSVSGRDASKALEDLRNGRPTWPWALAARTLDEPGFRELQARARALGSGDGDEARARALGASLAAALNLAVGPRGRRLAGAYLRAALSDLSAALGGAVDLSPLAAEIQRLEVSYG
jgi:geranylgeranyl pyrophosphate synthase